MPGLIEHVDAVARRTGRDVMYLESTCSHTGNV